MNPPNQCLSQDVDNDRKMFLNRNILKIYQQKLFRVDAVEEY